MKCKYCSQDISSSGGCGCYEVAESYMGTCMNCKALDLKTKDLNNVMGEKWVSYYCRALNINVDSKFFCKSFRKRSK